ncbi:MAG: GNAT family N-acetyltransferase [Ectothiorhodospiraceae bacterium]|nr:GNAT family N-acetyltransferase [Ectothiorhodospiraceae bacterium]
MDPMVLRRNRPLDTVTMRRLFGDRTGLRLVWPDAAWPFDHRQWHAALDPDRGHRSWLIELGGAVVGHGALRPGAEPGIRMVSFLYLAPAVRDRGHGLAMVEALVARAGEEPGVDRLQLRTRDYNPRAIRCYEKAGFRVFAREGTLVRMERALSSNDT